MIPIYGIARRTFGKSVAVGRCVGLGFSADLVFFPDHLDLGYGSCGSFPGVDFLGDSGHAGSEIDLAVGGLRRALGYGSFDQSVVAYRSCRFLVGWADLAIAPQIRVPWIKFSAAMLLVFAIAPGSMDDSQLSRVRQIHRAAIEFRPGIVARQ